MTSRVLVVEDEPDVSRLLEFALKGAGFLVRIVASGEAALLSMRHERTDVVVLDLMLPGISGHQVCREMRSDPALAKIGVLMLTARGDEHDRLSGLEVGADDYVVKPFAVREVVLRVGALARRTADLSDPSTRLNQGGRLRLRELEVDLATHDVALAGEPLSLRPLEYKLLIALMAAPGRVFSRGELLEKVWGLGGESSSRTVDVHVRRLRLNLGSAANLIETVAGFGYRAARAIGPLTADLSAPP